jgi:hypothetical protein
VLQLEIMWLAGTPNSDIRTFSCLLNRRLQRLRAEMLRENDGCLVDTASGSVNGHFLSALQLAEIDESVHHYGVYNRNGSCELECHLIWDLGSAVTFDHRVVRVWLGSEGTHSIADIECALQVCTHLGNNAAAGLANIVGDVVGWETIMRTWAQYTAEASRGNSQGLKSCNLIICVNNCR